MAGPLPYCCCTQSMPLLHVLWVVHNRLFMQAEDCSSHFALLQSWIVTLSYNGMWSKPHNVCCHLEAYLSQRYMFPPLSIEEIATRIDVFLITRGLCPPSCGDMTCSIKF